MKLKSRGVHIIHIKKDKHILPVVAEVEAEAVEVVIIVIMIEDTPVVAMVLLLEMDMPQIMNLELLDMPHECDIVNEMNIAPVGLNILPEEENILHLEDLGIIPPKHDNVPIPKIEPDDLLNIPAAVADMSVHEDPLVLEVIPPFLEVKEANIEQRPPFAKPIIPHEESEIEAKNMNHHVDMKADLLLLHNEDEHVGVRVVLVKENHID